MSKHDLAAAGSRPVQLYTGSSLLRASASFVGEGAKNNASMSAGAVSEEVAGITKHTGKQSQPSPFG